MYELIDGNISLKFALRMDMRQIYDMMVSDETGQFMFDEEHRPPEWASFFESERYLFPETASKEGSYLMIHYEGKLAGVISYICEYDKVPYAELTFWLAGYEFMGRGIGCKAIMLLKKFIHRSFGVEDFIVRSWTRNLSAIQTYNRCGFHEDARFNLSNFYSRQMMDLKGDGFYGARDTVNLYSRFSEDEVAVQ